jgi:predicted nucleotidyltransferase
MKLDVMALDEKLLGFSNRWYEGALKESQSVALPSGVTIRAIASPYFLGAKIEAFLGRGENDYIASHDLEDVMAVIDGRHSIALCPRELNEACAERLSGIWMHT